jgi:spermidine synthase
MGMTLPILARFLVRSSGRVGSGVGVLYFLNTLGAAVGVLVCGFWAVVHLGIWGTTWVAALGNGCVALLAFTVFSSKVGWRGLRSALARRADGKGVGAASADAGQVVQAPAGIRRAGVVLFAVAGFSGMAYEVIWTRLIGLLAGPTSYSFTLVLCGFVTGLAMGGICWGWLADRVRQPCAWAAALQLGSALAALWVSQTLGISQVFFAKLIYTFRSDAVLLELLKGSAIFLVLFPVAFLQGGMMPLVVRAWVGVRSGEAGAADGARVAVARTVGLSMAANTAGAVMGALVAAFGMVPWLGKECSLSLVVILQSLSAGWVALEWQAVQRRTDPARRGWPALAFAGVCLVTLLLAGFFPRWDRLRLAEGMYHRFDDIQDVIQSTGFGEALVGRQYGYTTRGTGETLLHYGDGVGGFCAVKRGVNSLGQTNVMLSISGKLDASSRLDRGTQVLSAHLPMLCHPAPKEVMVLGLASGMTAGEMLCYPVERMDIVEISPQVVQASHWFDEWNGRVLSDPRVQLVVQDGRVHLAMTDRMYDVISSEPSNPWIAGLADLYTVEFFRSVRARLKPGGVFVQFMHTYQMDWDGFSTVGRSILEVFPNSRLVKTMPEGQDYLFVCFRDDASSWAPLEANLESARRSKHMVIPSLSVIDCLVVAENLRDLLGPGTIHTEDRPVLESMAVSAMHASGLDIQSNLQARARVSQRVYESARRFQAPEKRMQLMVFLASLDVPIHGIAELSKVPASLRAPYERLLASSFRRNDVPLYEEVPRDVLPLCVQVHQRAAQAWLEVLLKDPDADPREKAAVFDRLARLAWLAGDRAAATGFLVEALRTTPGESLLLMNLGMVLSIEGRREGVADTLQRLDRLGPRSVRVLAYLASEKRKAGDEAGARRILASIVDVDPVNVAALVRLADLTLKAGATGEALRLAGRAVELDPRADLAHEIRVRACLKEGKPAQARRHLETGLANNPDSKALQSLRKTLGW